MKHLLIFFLLSFTLLYAQIGKITALKGDVLIKRDGQYKIAKLNAPINKLDIVTTEKNARIQLLFKDNTMISIGKNSTFSIEDYLYDVGKKPKLAFKFGQGAFKAITGKIGKLNPRGFKLKSKTASIGIRGTIIGLELSDKEETYLVPEGKIELKIGTKTFILDAGQMFIRDPKKPLGKPVRMTKKRKDKIERNSGANDNERESGLGEKTRTISVNNVEKCNYR